MKALLEAEQTRPGEIGSGGDAFISAGNDGGYFAPSLPTVPIATVDAEDRVTITRDLPKITPIQPPLPPAPYVQPPPSQPLQPEGPTIIAPEIYSQPPRTTLPLKEVLIKERLPLADATEPAIDLVSVMPTPIAIAVKAAETLSPVSSGGSGGVPEQQPLQPDTAAGGGNITNGGIPGWLILAAIAGLLLYAQRNK